MKKILLWVVIILVMVTGSAGATLFLTGALDSLMGGDQNASASVPGTAADTSVSAKAATPSAPPQFMSLDPPFVVNFDDQGMLRYLQVNVSVMAREQQYIDAVLANMPHIRNNLIMLMSNQDFETLGSLEGKEDLRSAALAEVQSILTKEIGAPGIEAVYFTNFVMQ